MCIICLFLHVVGPRAVHSMTDWVTQNKYVLRKKEIKAVDNFLLGELIFKIRHVGTSIKTLFMTNLNM